MPQKWRMPYLHAAIRLTCRDSATAAVMVLSGRRPSSPSSPAVVWGCRELCNLWRLPHRIRRDVSPRVGSARPTPPRTDVGGCNGHGTTSVASAWQPARRRLWRAALDGAEAGAVAFLLDVTPWKRSVRMLTSVHVRIIFLSMSVDLAAAIDSEISRLENRLSALQKARQALAADGDDSRGGRGVPRRRKYRKLTAAEKAVISRRMKETWKKRKAAAKAT